MLHFHLLALLYTFLISTTFTVVTQITGEYDSTLMTFHRFFIALVIFFFIANYKERLKIPDLKSLLRYSALGGFYALYFIFMFQSLKTSTTLNTSIMYTATPFISAIILLLVFKEKTSKRRLSILSFALIGAVWVIFDGSLQKALNFEILQGDFIFFLGVISMGFYMPLVKRFYKGENIYHYTFYSLFVGTLFLAIASLIVDVDIVAETLSYTQDVWIGILYLAIFTTAFTFFIIQYIGQHLNPVNLLAYSYLVPTIVIAIDFILGKGLPEAILLPGVFLTMYATYRLQREG